MPLPGLVLGIVTPEYLASDPALAALSECDAVEFRGDLFPEGGRKEYTEFARRLRGESRKPLTLMHTLRLQSDGGRWQNAEVDGRRAIWDDLACLKSEVKPDILDIEIEGFTQTGPDWVSYFRPSNLSVLISHHRFDGAYSPEEYSHWLKRLGERQPVGVKMAVTCKSEAEVFNLLRFARLVAESWPLSGIFSMGEIGKLSRVLAPLLGCPLTYGFLSGMAVAPGQWPVAELRRALNLLAEKTELSLKSATVESLWAETQKQLEKGRA